MIFRDFFTYLSSTLTVWTFTRMLQRGVLLFILSIQLLFGQNIPTTAANSGRLRVGLGMSANHYIGDLSNSYERYNRFQPGAYLTLQGEGKKKSQIRFGVGYATVRDQNDSLQYNAPAPNIHPNTFFSSNIIHAEALYTYNIRAKKRFNPYFGAGIGLLTYSPKDKKNLGLLDQDMTRVPDESYALFTLQAPFVVGCEFRITRAVALSASLHHRFLTTDYIDNIGTLGNKKGNDYLQSANVSVLITPNPSKAFKPYYIPPKEQEKLDQLMADTMLIREMKKQYGFPSNPQPPEEERNYFKMLNAGSEYLYELGKELEKSADTTANIITPLDDMMDEIAYDEYGWLWKALEDKALKDNQTFTYTWKEGDTYFTLYERFRIKPSTIRRINQLSIDTELASNKTIIIPDIRKWVDMFPDFDRIIAESGVTPPQK